ncbi:MAG: ABC transporter permease [Pseudomonadales bacterium]|nr:ABC transporter permease [Pseudomonadales bacterium]
MHPILAVFKKELIDGRRDKRAVMSAFIFPIMAPALVYFMLTAIIELRDSSKSITIPVEGAEYAPALIQWLEERDVTIEDFSGDAKEAVKNKDKELVFIIPSNYQEKLKALKTISIQVVLDGSRTDARPTINQAGNLLRRYNREVASLRLIARGVSPEVMSGIVETEVDVASKQERTAQALNFIPLYIILAAFVSGMGIAVDSTAGERERKTLEPLIINPVERYQIVMGKWFAASLFSSLGMAMTLVLCIVSMLQVPLDQIGLTFNITVTQILAMLIATLPLAFLAASMQMFLGIFAKSFKDAQSYIGILTILPVIPSLYMTFKPLLTQDWMFGIPMLGQHLLLVDILGGKSVPMIGYFLSAFSCLLLGIGLSFITAKLFERESIIAN